MGKESAVPIYNGILLSYKIAHTWVSSNGADETEPIIQSEVSQKEKHQYSVLTHIYGIQKNGNDNLIHKAAKETQT